MKKYYLSHIDFSEIVNVTADENQLERAKKRMTELGLLTEKGNPAPAAISSAVSSLSKAFAVKLQKRLRRRDGGINAVKETLQKLNDRKDYYGFFMYVAFLYGFLEWQVPERIMLLPAVPEALKCYCNELMAVLNEFSQESEDNVEDVSETNL